MADPGRWQMNRSQSHHQLDQLDQYDWTRRSGNSRGSSRGSVSDIGIGIGIQLFWLAERPSNGQEEADKIVKADSTLTDTATATARPLVGAMLTMILAWLLIRNLIGWHRNLQTTDGQSGRLVTLPHGLRRRTPYRTRWTDQADWIDYDADDSDSLDANGLPVMEEDDHERLFIGVCHPPPLALVPPLNPADVTTTTNRPLDPLPARCALYESLGLEEEAEEDVTMLGDLTSLSSDAGWTSSGGGESVAVTGQEPPLHPALLVRSPLAACYLGRPDRNNNKNSSDSDSELESESNSISADDFQSLSSSDPSFISASTSLSSFDDAASDCLTDFDTASSGSIADRVR